MTQEKTQKGMRHTNTVRVVGDAGERIHKEKKRIE